MSMMAKRKGGRYAYRPADIDIPMTREEALQHAAEKQNILNGEANIMNAFNTMAPAGADLAGRTFKIWNDKEKYAQAPWSGDKGKAWEYEIVDGTTLKWRHGSRKWQEEQFACFQPDKDLYFFAHMLTGDPDYSMAAQIVPRA